jgi:hypothetical protein
MLYNAENSLYRAIGGFSTIAQVSINNNIGGGGYVADSFNLSFYQSQYIPSQCAALITSNYVFTLFVESWDISRETGDPVFQNKKVYPAKVTGLSIPYSKSQTYQWKEGLIDNSFNQVSEYNSYFRPGFGETILSDLQRPFISTSVVGTNLGLDALAVSNGYAFAGPFGRLMSMAFWVDPIEAEKYDASQSKKKKKSLNSQDYEQMPTYPDYTPYVDPYGY